MSHVDNISTNGEQFSLPAILHMCKRKGWTFLENQKTYAWYGRSVGDYPVPVGTNVEDLGKCDHAIRIPGAKYEVGLKKIPGTDNYNVQADFWRGGALDRILGAKGERFAQEYYKTKAIMTAESKGWAWEEMPATVEGALKIKVTMGQEWGGGQW